MSYKKLEDLFDLCLANGVTTEFAWIPGAADFESFATNAQAYEQFKHSAGNSKFDISKNNSFKWEAAKLFHPFTYNIPIKYKDDVALTIWLFGTGRYDCMGMGGNDCIRRDAIEWYREESNKLPLDNKFRKNGIAFMHFPLQEHMQMVDSQPVHGHRRDYVGC